MDTQQSSRSQAPRKQASEKQTNTGLDFIFKRPIFWRPSYIAQSAWLEHIPFAFWLIDTLQPRKIVELGTHYGSSYFSFCQAVTKLDLETQCYAVDTWGGDEHAGQYGEEVYRQVSEHNQQHYSDFSTLVRSTFDQALEHFPQGSIDLLHIDGLHTLEALRHDFESWLPKLSNKAVVIMHDTNVRERGFGVFQLMDELKQQYPHFEFAHGHGLGVIGVGSEQSSEMLSLYALSGNPSATRQVQEVFSRLGKACGYSWENSEIKRQMVALQANQQAQTQDVMEQQALERGRLAEKITAQHHTIKALEEKLAQHTDQSAELNLQKQQVSALTAELEKSNQHASELQTALTLCEQQRDESLASLQNLKTQLSETREQFTQTVAERDLIAQEKQTLLAQQTEAQEQQSALQQQLHEQALHLNEETQRAAQLTLALNKNNVVLSEYSQQLSALQQHIDELTTALTTAHQQQDELSQTLATEASQWQQKVNELTTALTAAHQQQDELSQTLATEASQWQQQKQILTEANDELQNKCDVLTTDLAASRAVLEQFEAAQQVWQTREQDLDSALNAREREIAHLNQSLAESNQAIDKQNSELELARDELAVLLQRHHAEQAESQQQLSQLNQSLSERFTEIATLTQWLEEREQTSVNEQRKLTEEHQQHLSVLRQTLSEQVSEIATLTRNLEERDQAAIKAAEEYHLHQQAWRAEQASMAQANADLQQELTTLQQQATQQQAQLGTRINELVKQNEALESSINERFRELATMTRHTEQLTRELQQKEQQLQKAKDRAQNLKQTVSWKLTAPVRALGRTFKESPSTKPSASMSNAERIAASGLFDELWYLHRYPEVADTGLSAIEHFIQIGADKGYSPSELFDTRWYLQTYADVAQGTINPLLHYIMHGQAEQRHCLPDNMRK
ncbi:class I SAM-dependent methyltransferase [Escherichia coli]|uniref:class I SAM-dependent methyltransferase n=1 Tax=Escherichia coli TaxID=562 RepID=UPI0023F6E49C|nr:class I SAM-dependent methyltransferase [Escherichia coli]MDF7563544.1 class I SAM-dependent methyltransferase [Escherichia coli]MDF7605662.1 class I SAM-dependent methyltransferase [Escherichia coli]MDF7620960.1 class I SAM-dependent methyltransferase [Escherichia coli]